MHHVHYHFTTTASATITISLGHHANVLLMDDANYARYANRQSYMKYGGWYTVTPVRLHPPHAGSWHVVVDLNGQQGQIRSGASIQQ